MSQFQARKMIARKMIARKMITSIILGQNKHSTYSQPAFCMCLQLPDMFPNRNNFRNKTLFHDYFLHIFQLVVRQILLDSDNDLGFITQFTQNEIK